MGPKLKSVYDVRNRSFKQKQWTKISLEIGPFKGETKCLVMQNVSFEFLISRPLMRNMKMNLHLDDTISFGSPIQPVKEQANTLRNREDLKLAFPNTGHTDNRAETNWANADWAKTNWASYRFLEFEMRPGTVILPSE